MKKILLFCVTFILVTQIAYAQRVSMDEVVYLKNGSIVHGVIVEQVPNKSLKIETADGSLFVFEMDEVEKITKESKTGSNRKAYQQTVVEESNKRLGRPMGIVQFCGFGYQDSYESYDSYYYEDGATYFSYHFIYGYQFKNRFFIGGGIGMEHLIGIEDFAGDEYTDSYNLRIPLFAAAKINLNTKRVSPFFQFDMGYHFNTDDYTEDGVFFLPKFGVDFNLGRSRRKALFCSLSLVEYGIRTEFGYNNYHYSDYQYYNHNEYDFYAKIGLNFGLRF